MIRSIYAQLQELKAEASSARDSAYNSGYLDALGLLEEIIETAAWEGGVDLESG